MRAIGRQLGLAPALLDRHPFPGPGLAIRCLCTTSDAHVEKLSEGWLLPVQTVGVQGDSRTYRAVLAIDGFPDSHEESSSLINKMDGINRVVAEVWTAGKLGNMQAVPGFLTPERLTRLRQADAVVRRLTHASGFDQAVWQFPWC